ncbi:hypothetical protein EKD04_015240 [Chloroflexales bacterium ZM16-3]|nr:hypothetical protein [Chloroflexales bacterium ZM16-3]
MSHRSLFWPITLIAIVAATLVLILIGAPVGPSEFSVSAAIKCPTDGANPAYPDCLATQTAEAKTATGELTSPTTDPARIMRGCPTDGASLSPPYPPYEDCLKTRTALLLQTEQAGYTATPIPPPVSAAPSSTPTSTFTVTPTFTETAIATAFASATRSPTRLIPTSTATPTAPLDSTAVLCVPGQTIIIDGSADPSVALIVTFGGRPVGGGFSRDDGSYRLRLRIGDERPGTYLIEVEDRDTSALFKELTCQVPAFTPTPTVPLVP